MFAFEMLEHNIYHEKKKKISHCLNYWQFPIYLDDQKGNGKHDTHGKRQHSNNCIINSTIFKYKTEEHFHDKIEVESHLGVRNGIVPAVLLAEESQYL